MNVLVCLRISTGIKTSSMISFVIKIVMLCLETPWRIVSKEGAENRRVLFWVGGIVV